MALSNAKIKEILSEAGLTGEELENAAKRIADGHVTSINALREERDTLKADLEAAKEAVKDYDNVVKERDELKSKSNDDWKKKFDDEHDAFEKFKTGIENEKTSAEKRKLYKNLLKGLNVESTRIDAILKVTDIDALELDDGKLKDEEKLTETAKKEWSGFILNPQKKGAEVDKPPVNGGGESKEKSRAAQLAADYHKQLYGEKKGE